MREREKSIQKMLKTLQTVNQLKKRFGLVFPRDNISADIQAPIFETSAKTGHNVGEQVHSLQLVSCTLFGLFIEELFHQIAEDFGKSQGITNYASAQSMPFICLFTHLSLS